MDAAVAGLVGAFIGALAGLGSAWIAQHGQAGQWKLQRRDETYMLLGEWIAENWTWAVSLTGPGTVQSLAGEPEHSQQRQVEVAVNLHASPKVNVLLDAYAKAYVNLANDYREFSSHAVFSGSASDNPYQRVRSGQDALCAAGDALMNQMAKELRPSMRRLV